MAHATLSVDHLQTGGMEKHAAPKRTWIFVGWLAGVYCLWLLIVSLGRYWATVAAHWPIAAAMAVGSYFAGSTPMGGGTVGFPVLVLLFDYPASLGRSFGLASQSVGMVSATIFLFSMRRPLAWRLLRPALVGSLIATPLGAALIAPYVPDLWVKMIFAVIWASFGLMHFFKLRDLVARQGFDNSPQPRDWPVGLAIGVAGGITASITGVGIEMINYAVLVLLYRADLKIAIPTSVVLMAFTSVVGIAANLALAAVNPQLHALPPELFANWLTAVPVVVLGAPLGALLLHLIPRWITLIVVSTLCLAQFVWMCLAERLQGLPLAAALIALAAMTLFFHFLFRLGQRYQH